jgi:hypothetical protein
LKVVGKDEIFKRIRTKTLAQLLQEEGWDMEDEKENNLQSQTADMWKRPDTAQDLMQNQDITANPKKSQQIRSFLLLDTRGSKEEFDNCRIVGGIL